MVLLLLSSTFNTWLIFIISTVVTVGFGLYMRRSNAKRDTAREALRQKYEEARMELEASGERELNMSTRMSALEGMVEVVKAQAVPVNAAFQAILIKQLTHLHTPEMDELMVKLGDVAKNEPPTINDEEEARLIVLLKDRMDDDSVEIPDDERDAAEILIIQIRRTRREAELVASGVPMQDIKVIGFLPETPSALDGPVEETHPRPEVEVPSAPTLELVPGPEVAHPLAPGVAEDTAIRNAADSE